MAAHLTGSKPDSSADAYAAPALTVIGGIWEHTLHGCWWGKEFGGSDGFTFMGIDAAISNCSA